MCSYGSEMRLAFVILALTALSFGSPAASAQGQWGNSFDRSDSQREQANVPLGQIFQQLKRRYGGYQIDASLRNRGGKQVYIIDWMTGKGERKTITVDAKSGRILSSN